MMVDQTKSLTDQVEEVAKLVYDVQERLHRSCAHSPACKNALRQTPPVMSHVKSSQISEGLDVVDEPVDQRWLASRHSPGCWRLLPRTRRQSHARE